MPIVGLAHAGLGVATGVALIPVVAPAVDPIWVYAGFAAVAAVILIVTRGALGYESGRSDPDRRRGRRRGLSYRRSACADRASGPAGWAPPPGRFRARSEARFPTKGRWEDDAT